MIKLRKILLCDFIFYIFLFISIIYIFIYINNYKVDKLDINTNEFNLTIKEYKTDGNKLSIEFKENIIGTYYFETKEEKEEFTNIYELNDKIYIKGKLNEFNNNTVFNGFNYKKYMYHKNILYNITIESYDLIGKNKNVFYKIKNYVYRRVNSIDNNEYLYAFILGKSSYIEDEVYNNYKINGITHLFALSGLHVSLFASILMFVLNKLKLNEKLTLLIVSISLIFFSFIASFTPSILRATIFFILSSINNIYYFYIKPKNLLYLTFIILVIINPMYIFNTGFILSFTITFFILIFNENIKINNKLLSILVISILSLFSSLPIIINMSYEINVLGFFNNIFFIPYVSYIVFPFSLVVIIFPPLTKILLILTSIMERISSFTSNILVFNIIFSKLNIIEIIVYYILFILIIKKYKKVIYLFLVFLIFLYIKPNIDNNDYIYYIDVSQGDSILLLIDNKSVLIDTGGKEAYLNKDKWKTRNKTYNLMIDTTLPFLKSIGLKKIDYLILTHGDADHMGESINLINNFKVKNVVFNCGNNNNLENNLYKLLNEKNINNQKCINELIIKNYNLQFLNTKEYNNENDNSNVIYFNYEGYKFLFMGDAGIDKEKDILEKYKISNVDFLKVGHHGSNTSSSEHFINSINPKYSIISVGKNNRYGHPKTEVLDTLNKSKIYRTDLNGSIEIKLNKNGYKIRTCSP